MRRMITALAAVGLLGAAGCEADRETFEETDATLEPPPAVEAARENPVNPTGAALGDQDSLSAPGAAGGAVQGTGTGTAADTAR